jgi:hypothetical protein
MDNQPQLTLGCFDTLEEAERLASSLQMVFEYYSVEAEIEIAQLRTAKKTGKTAYLVFMTSFELDETLKLKTLDTIKTGE